jgi:hypothetical protein
MEGLQSSREERGHHLELRQWGHPVRVPSIPHLSPSGCRSRSSLPQTLPYIWSLPTGPSPMPSYPHHFSAWLFQVFICLFDLDFLAVLGFELMSLLYHLSCTPISFMLYFLVRVSHFCLGPDLDLYPPIYASLAGITGVNHHIQLFFPGLTLNQDSLDLCLPNSWDYSCEPPGLAHHLNFIL